MKTIGLIGGMSWESSSVYYQLINREVQKRLGGVHSAKILMYSLDFAEMSGALQPDGNWADTADRLITAGATLAKGGADFLLICSNSMHLLSEEVEKGAGIPLLHIADPLGEKILLSSARRVGLIGTTTTMEKPSVISGRLQQKFGIECLIPAAPDRTALHRIIIDELVRGQFLDVSRAACNQIDDELVRRGAEGIILGCTEFPILLRTGDCTVPLFDTTALHALAAVDLALA